MNLDEPQEITLPIEARQGPMDFFSKAPEVPPMFKHQIETGEFYAQRKFGIDGSDPGTGKTRSLIEHLRTLMANNPGKKALILAPKSILDVAWGNDIRKFAPELTFAVAHASNRAKAFRADVQLVITNHDAVKWVEQNVDLSPFILLAIDEVTAFKNHTAQRSAACKRISSQFEYRYALGGTLTPNSVTELFHPVLIIDQGERLGTKFYSFRAEVCTPKPVAYHSNAMEWTDKPGAQELVAELIGDILIRHKFEECLDIPTNSTNTVEFELLPAHMATYKTLERDAILEMQNEKITAINAGALANKLLQCASGAVYGGDGEYHVVDTQRYEITMQLVEEREQCVVAFSWRHQRDQLTRLAKAMGMPFAVIDGDATQKQRRDAVTAFQLGKLKVILAHPAAAAHGITLTRGTTTIWASPTHNLEHFLQFNRRIYRAGQTRKTETILMSARGTVDSKVYANVMGKNTQQTSMNDLFQQLARNY